MASSLPNSPHMSAADRERKRRRQPISISGAPAHPLEDDNILPEILLRLPPLPSSLPRAAPVCDRWGSIVSDPHFHRRFLAHHKKAPLLGFFYTDKQRRVCFKPALDPPNRLPPARFSFQFAAGSKIQILDCRHGRLLVTDGGQKNVVVWESITGDHHHVCVPQEFKEDNIYTAARCAVLCAARDNGHIHGACHSDPFQVVFLGWTNDGISACIYSSETGTAGNLISFAHQPATLTIIPDECQNSLIGNSLYWLLVSTTGGILELDLHSQTLAVTDAPPDTLDAHAFLRGEREFFIMRADHDGLSFINLEGFSAHVWRRITNGNGDATWVLNNTVELSDILSLNPRVNTVELQEAPLRILGVDEDGKVIFRLSENGAVYMVHLETLQFKELTQKMGWYAEAHPFKSFYTAGMHINKARNGDENANKA